MIWGSFSVKGVVKTSVIDDKMNAQKYKQIMQENLMSSFESLELPSDYIFLRDNDPKHTAKKFKSKKEHQQTSIIWRQYARKNGTKYLLIIARN